MLARGVPGIKPLDSRRETEYECELRAERAPSAAECLMDQYGPMNPRVWIGPTSEHRQEEPFEGREQRLRLVDEHVLRVQPALEDQQ